MAEVFDFGLQQHKIKMDGKFFENNLFAVAGDTGRRLEVQLLDSGNLVQNTTGISLRLNANVAGQATYAEATLVNATKGLYELDLPNGMLIAPGNWQFQWQIIGANGEKLHSFAFMGTIGSNLAEGAAEGLNFYLNLEDLKQMQEDFISGAFNSEVLETNIAEKLTNLETQYAPKLAEVTAQLAQTYANVKTFGAVGDGLTDDTNAIQSAIDSSGVGWIENTTNGKPRTVLIPNGVYKISKPLVVNKNDVRIIGTGNANLMASDDFDPLSLSGIMHVGKSINESYYTNFFIDNVTFTSEGGDPFNAYNVGKYGVIGAYDYEQSTLGLRIDHCHFYTVKNCKFIGLKLGLWLSGAWAGAVDNCKYFYNNRHLLINSMPGRATNQVTISHSVFNGGVTNGTVAVVDGNRIHFEHCDIERNFRTAFLLRSSKATVFNHCYFEMNNYKTNVNDTPTFYADSIYKTTISDSLSDEYKGYTLYETLTQGLTFNDTLFNTMAEGSKGFIYSDNNLAPIEFNRCSLRADSLNKTYSYMIESPNIRQPITFNDSEINPKWKLSNSIRVNVYDKRNQSQNTTGGKDIYWVDFDNGNDYQAEYENTEISPIKDINALLIGIPKDYPFKITINVKGTKTFGGKYFDTRLTNGGTIEIVGDGITTTKLDKIDMDTPLNGHVIFNKLSLNGTVGDYTDQGGFSPRNGIVEFKNCTITANSNLGTVYFSSTGKLKVIIDNCSLVQPNSSFITLNIRINKEFWLKNTVLSTTVQIGDYSKLYRANSYLTVNNSTPSMHEVKEITIV